MSALQRREAGLTLAARFHILRRVGAIYHLRENAGRGSLSDSARTAEKVGMRKLPPENGILQGLRYIVLANQCSERVWPVFSCRYYILGHTCSLVITGTYA